MVYSFPLFNHTSLSKHSKYSLPLSTAAEKGKPSTYTPMRGSVNMYENSDENAVWKRLDEQMRSCI
jgi:hypothetical protein